MKTLNALTANQAGEATRNIFTAIMAKVGRVPNLYAAMGVSDKLLGGFLNFSETLKSGSLNNKEYETIALATSQVNGCDYCLAAHTAIGQMNGLTEEETIKIRNGESTGTKLDALSKLTLELVGNWGKASEQTVQDFFDAGYSKAAFAEVIGAIALTTLTNYVYHNGDFEIDFPKAKTLTSEVEF